jgi:hypothetical protein
MKTRILSLVLVVGCTIVQTALADTQRRNIDGIADNSFLVEEAYNQTPGVVQHIFNAHYEVPRTSRSSDRSWELAFTQEWPFLSQQHQLSYTVSHLFVRENGRSTEGIGDVALHYRYQAFFDEETLTAFAPRLSVILPTGDADKGFGEDSVGYQVNLPFSTTFGDKWFLHLNAGATFIPDAASLSDRDAWNINLGASVIYAATEDLHFLVEWIGDWDSTLLSSDKIQKRFSTIAMPGVRKAFNFKTGGQLVLGLGIPIGLNAAAPDIGAFLYLSFEHAFRESSE